MIGVLTEAVVVCRCNLHVWCSPYFQKPCHTQCITTPMNVPKQSTLDNTKITLTIHRDIVVANRL